MVMKKGGACHHWSEGHLQQLRVVMFSEQEKVGCIG